MRTEKAKEILQEIHDLCHRTSRFLVPDNQINKEVESVRSFYEYLERYYLIEKIKAVPEILNTYPDIIDPFRKMDLCLNILQVIAKNQLKGIPASPYIDHILTGSLGIQAEDFTVLQICLKDFFALLDFLFPELEALINIIGSLFIINCTDDLLPMREVESPYLGVVMFSQQLARLSSSSYIDMTMLQVFSTIGDIILKFSANKEFLTSETVQMLAIPHVRDSFEYNLQFLKDYIKETIGAPSLQELTLRFLMNTVSLPQAQPEIKKRSLKAEEEYKPAKKSKGAAEAQPADQLLGDFACTGNSFFHSEGSSSSSSDSGAQHFAP